MRTVWKYELSPDTRLNMPKGAKVLAAHEQGHAICIWAEVDSNAELEMRRFLVVGTGHEVPEEAGKFIGTVRLDGATLVFHVYEAA